MDSIEADGSTIDDAIARALARLGVSRDRVEIEIIANATRGLFGFGGKRARVRATLRRPVTLDVGLEMGPEVARVDSQTAPAATASEPPRHQTAPAAPSGRTPPRRPERARHTAPVGAPRSERPRPAREPVRPTERPAPRPPRLETPPEAAAIERGRTVLTEIVRLTGVEATVEVATDGLRIIGDADGLLIGRRGQTLDALEYFVNRAIGHDDGSAVHLGVDANDYRDRRRQTLEALARRMAERARTRGRPVSLEPMSPRDRRIVHLVLEDDTALTTHSAGSGFYRRLIIAPAGTRPGRRRAPPS